MLPTSARIERIDAALPQTQCRRCGYADCREYAAAIDSGTPINRCPPGGAEGVQRLAQITGQPLLALDPDCGDESPRRLAWVDESACIGCTLCLQACPVDAIAGAPKRMHAVLADWCTGCELCVAPCPTDCIHMLPLPAQPQATGWAAWSATQAELARQRYGAHRRRHEQQATQRARSSQVAQLDEPDLPGARKQQLVLAALERARQRQASRPPAAGATPGGDR